MLTIACLLLIIFLVIIFICCFDHVNHFITVSTASYYILCHKTQNLYIFSIFILIMSQIEQIVIEFFSKNPDVRLASEKGLINRRALARYIIKNMQLNPAQLDAVIGVLRRNEGIKKPNEDKIAKLISKVKINSKEDMVILTLEKNPNVFEKIKQIAAIIEFNKNQTLKVIQGSLSLKLIFDEINLGKIKEFINNKDIIEINKNISELNLIFPHEAILTKGIISAITSYLYIGGINIIELLTCTPELTLYIKDEDLLNSYFIIKRLKK